MVIEKRFILLPLDVSDAEFMQHPNCVPSSVAYPPNYKSSLCLPHSAANRSVTMLLLSYINRNCNNR